MNLRSYKRRRYATPGYGHWAVATASRLAWVREQRRALLMSGSTRREISRVLASAAPRIRRMIRRMVAADLGSMRAAGEWADLATFADFLSPYAQRVLQARRARRGAPA